MGEMPPTSMYGDPHSRAALDTLAAHHAAAAQHMQNHPSRNEKLHFLHSDDPKLSLRLYINTVSATTVGKFQCKSAHSF